MSDTSKLDEFVKLSQLKVPKPLDWLFSTTEGKLIVETENKSLVIGKNTFTKTAFINAKEILKPCVTFHKQEANEGINIYLINPLKEKNIDNFALVIKNENIEELCVLKLSNIVNGKFVMKTISDMFNDDDSELIFKNTYNYKMVISDPRNNV